MINVTKTFLPPISEYHSYLRRIWSTGWVTNNGALVVQLEDKLKRYLGVKHLFFVSNGTVALQIAIKALDITKEIITTPFSYVASTSAIVWGGCKPVYSDIEINSLCLDPTLIESKINRNTQAILAVHVYGNPCDTEAIGRIARKHNLKVIYDAAHAFNVKYVGQPILNYGDISTISFHATKLFHTIEGGAVVTNDDHIAHKISYMRNFGHNGPEEFFGLGINGKNSEFHAAMGLCILPHVNKIVKTRKVISELYSSILSTTDLRYPIIRKKCRYNYAYYPVIFPSEKALKLTQQNLLNDGISTRRYFYPALDTLNYVKRSDCFNSSDISKRILCLPIYPSLSKKNVIRIATIIKNTLTLNT